MYTVGLFLRKNATDGFLRLVLKRGGIKFYSTKGNNDSNKDLIHKKDQSIDKKNGSSASSPASPASMSSDNGLQYLMKKDKRPYFPYLNRPRMSYEYPGLPNEDDFSKSRNGPKSVNRWSRYLPKILTAVAVAWGAYSIKVWIYQPEEGSDDQELLNPSKFHKFIVTQIEDIGSNCYLVELTPKFSHWMYSYSNKGSIWDGDRIWSIEVKQPEIQVVRSYTPLPLYYMKSEYTRSGERKPLLRVIDGETQEYDKGGVMTLYIKKYEDGEVSRYIAGKKVGDELEIRGPYIDYRFPYHPAKKFYERPAFKDLPSTIKAEKLFENIKAIHNIPSLDNVIFFAGGTGIAPCLQVLFSKNPYRGFITLHYSAKSESELGPISRFIYFLERLDRVKFIPHYDDLPKTRLQEKDICTPQKAHYISDKRLEDIESSMTEEEMLKLRLSIMDKKTEELANQGDPNTHSKYYDNAIEQAIVTSKTPKEPPSLALVCGPYGYVDYISGGTGANGEQNPVTGMLGKKKWDNYNTFKF